MIRNGSSIPNESARIPAREIEHLVLSELTSFFLSADKVVEALVLPGDDVSATTALLQSATRVAKELEVESGAAINQLLVAIMPGIIIRHESVELQLNRRAIRARFLGRQSEGADHGDNSISLTVSAKLRRCRGEMRLIIPSSSQDSHKPVPSLLRAISRAHEWVRMIEAGVYKDQRDVAAATDPDEHHISRILPAAFLAPEIVEAIVEGRHPPDLTLDKLRRNIPLNWNLQK